MAEEEAWSDLAAVMEESIHGQDDVRTSLARPYVLRLYAQRASEVLRARAGGCGACRRGSPPIAAGVIRAGIAVVVRRRRVGAGHRPRSTAPGSPPIWLLALGFGGTVEHLSRMVPELQNALGAWGRVQLLRDAAAGAGRRRRPGRRRPRRSAA